MKKLLAVLLSLLFASSAFAAQNSNTNSAKKPKAAPVDCAAVDDATITANVKDKLSKTPSLKDATINVETKVGVVTLTGMVKTGRNKGLATLQTRRVACVKKVENQLGVEQTKNKKSNNE